MKPSLLLIVYLFSLPALSQQFEWAASGGNLNGGFRSSVMDSRGNIIVSGHAYMPSIYRGNSYLFNSSGDSTEIAVGYNPLLIISFDPSGKMNWQREVWNAGEDSHIGIDSKGNILVLGTVTGRTHFPGLPYGFVRGNYNHFLYILDKDGHPQKVVFDTLNIIKEPVSFHTSGNDIVISGYRTQVMEASNTEACIDFIMKLDESLHVKWQEEIVHKECHGFSIPSAQTDVAPNGDIYFCSNIQNGARFGKTLFTAPPFEPPQNGVQPWDSYIACYNTDGKLKWVKNCNARIRIHAIKATNYGVIIGAEQQNTNRFFGHTIDTSGKKIMALASFNSNGNLQWVKMSKADYITAITTDQQQNIYACVISKTAYPQPLMYENDTLRNTYESLILASYTAKGDFRWVKNCKVPLNTNHTPALLTDGCGNLYIAGEMWSVLRAQLKWFDAAFVKGNSYGDAPFIAKIKNTLPKVVAEKINHNDVCIISPAPWTLDAYPNPFKTQATARYKITYADKAALLLYDMNGKLVSTLFTSREVKPGIYTVAIDAANFAKGVYVLVLKGTEAVATEKVIIQ